MDSERLLQGLLVIVDYGGLVERLAALRLLARVPWPEEAKARAAQMISDLSPESAGVVYAQNFLPPRALRSSVIQLVESAPIDLRRVIQIYGSARSDLNDRLDQPIDELSDDLAEQLLLGNYALLPRPELDEVDPDARQGEGNHITEIAARVRHRHIPRRSGPLFDIYLALFPRAFRFWINWLEEYEDQYLPNFIPTYAGHLSASWQIAWAASANSVDEILDLVPDVLVSENALARLAILHFAELTLRYAKSEWMPLFGGWSVAPDTLGRMGSTGSEFELDEFDGGTRVSAEEPAVSEVEWEEAPPWAATEAAEPAAEPPSPEVYHTLEKPLPVGPPMLVILPPFPLAGDPPSPGRHADFTFHEEVSGRRSERVPNGATLQVTAKYHLEVAVRTTRTGIPAAGEAQPIQEPGRKEDVKILVVADSSDGGFEIPEPVQYLTLPPNGGSRQNAWFKGVKAVRATGYASELLQIRVRLYYNLNLIEVAIIEAEAVALFQSTQESRLGLEKPIRFHQKLRERDYGNLELIQPRGMHILVGARSGGVDLSFVLEREGRADTVLSGTARVPEDSLEDSLYAIRRALLKMTTLGDFSGNSKDDAAFIASMRGLADLGRALWTRLFELESESALFHIGEWLWEHPLPASSMIQVSAESGAFAFVLPWNLLYDRDLPTDKDALPDPEGFWGVRYQIEQRAATSDATDESTHPVEPVELGYLTWPFAETPLQGAFLQDMAQRSQGRMSTIRAIDSAKEAMAYLTAGASHIVCFFAHGHTQFRGAERVGFSESDFVKLYQDLPAGSPLHDAWRDFYDEIQQRRYESDRSWIMLHTGRIYLSQLYQIKGLCFEKKPVVLLNMCESAQLTPSLRESFIHFFLDRGAAAVVGTECSMCPQFAHLFAKELLAGLLAGEALGKVMVEARTKFLNQRNPLGLAYTLFGSPTARFQPALVDRSAEAPGSAAAPSSPASD